MMTSLRHVVLLLAVSSFVLHADAVEERSTDVEDAPQTGAATASIPDLPPDHLQRYLNTFPQMKPHCSGDGYNGDVATTTTTTACWGHEDDCDAADRFQTPICPHEYAGAGQSKQAQITTFFYQADFGYVQQQISELSIICEPSYRDDSSLQCSRYLRFCRGRNLRFDLRAVAQRKELIRYHMDVLQPGHVGGHCKLNRTRLTAELDHLGALQSWAPELRNFVELPEAPLTHNQCDMVVETPTFIMKIDAMYNMYHHFCDFFNLYASLFVNQSHPLAFDRDVRILIWETYPYDSPFAATFKAFTQHPIWTLNDVKGKRVCFRNVVMPLLPRMIFGLYYNTPLIFGCQNSGLFRAFSEFILHRLHVPHEPPATNDRVRITFLARRTKYRRVLNEDELIEAITANATYHVRRISFENGLDFTEQLAITRNSDVLIGMHGAGLTHLLFLPNWASIFELYNCEDANCYKDLARLRGVNYLTWQRSDLVYPEDEGHHPQQGGAHAKFTNYAFDRDEFVRLVASAAAAVRMHPEYQQHATTIHTQITRDEL